VTQGALFYFPALIRAALMYTACYPRAHPLFPARFKIPRTHARARAPSHVAGVGVHHDALVVLLVVAARSRALACRADPDAYIINAASISGTR